MSKKSALPPQPSNPLALPNNRHTTIVFLAAVMSVVFLAACGGEATSTASEAQPTTAPTATPTPTPNLYEDFATATVPSADPERLARLSKLLSLVPESYTSAVYLDTESLRSNASLAGSISPEVLGIDLALPSIATRLVNAIAVAGDVENRSLVTSFESDSTIVAMLQVVSSFGLQLSEGSPQTYKGHNIWDINALGIVLALAAADETTGLAASGQDEVGLAKAALDAFDGRSARLLDAPGLANLVGDVPSGFAAVVCKRRR